MVTVSSELELELVLAVGCITLEVLSSKLVVPTSFAATTLFCPVSSARKSDSCRLNGTDLDSNISCAFVFFTGSTNVDVESLVPGRLICLGK